ncbi:MAG TPA: antibiotic biosynthesis monooxygenase [Vibrio sp.]|nr:antibiotic biosynthesis monooxygenase [Vibrio sp.]
MFAVIFRAKAGVQDDTYIEMVAVMRQLAFDKYHCQDFIAVTEGEQEITISYWNNEEDIRNWHKDSKHVVAQKIGQEKWYQSYTVQVVEIKRQYSFGE